MATGASMAGWRFRGVWLEYRYRPRRLERAKALKSADFPPPARSPGRALLARAAGVERRDLLRDVVALAVEQRHRRVEGGVLGAHPLLDPVEADLERVLVFLVALQLLAEAVGPGRQGAVDAEHGV